MENNNKKTKYPAFKIVFIGDSAVGKSSIIQSFANKTFSSKYDTTVGTDFTSKEIKINANTTIILQIWDTAGQECFRSLIKSFFHNTVAFFIVYDITNSITYDNANVWLNEISENCSTDPIKVLVGNKCDLPGREIKSESAQKFIKERQIDLFFETSALKNENINEAFIEVSKLILLKENKKSTIDISQETIPKIAKIEENPINLSNDKKIEKNEKKSGCC